MRSRFHRYVLAALAAAASTLLLCAQSPAMPPIRPAAGLPPLDPGFLWGVAASGFQSEGHAPDSNWTRYIAANPEYDELRDSVDFYDRYASDIRLAADLGVRVFRIGIEWARLQPAPGVWDEGAFRFYDAVIASIEQAGMRPMITLDHWVYPGWAVDRGGWRSPGMVGDWLANMRRVVDRYASHDPLWVTVNEPVAYIVHEIRRGAADAAQMEERIAHAHNAIYDYIHQVQPGAQVTSNVGYVAGSEAQVNGAVVDRIADRLDYVGVDYYFAYDPAQALLDSIVRASGSAMPNLPGPRIWELPLRTEGIYYALQHYSRRFPNKPIYIVENGMPTENGLPRGDGYTRSDHFRDTVYWIQRAEADGIDVMGYNYWSITDNYEWGSYTPRFGLYTVNVRTDPTLTRHPTDAVGTYAQIVAAGGVPAAYRPTRGPAICFLVDPPASCLNPVAGP
ncbi:glycoside hydrolase family 1 protein [Nocardia amamiensis]|uniref:Glycoside hydrolase family 1 protein n=1 Tax=Nocardia amamiensis TaxID=404578 RepID=A0ABS0D4X2_9NOCA|nr:family 1 glycosylhydrolase [Nocardia amamiensis]MBF6302219.1 glycoside hydrolase family 1 protein [Nocardia amamiensis]